MTTGIMIESALVFGLQIAPEIEKKIAKTLNFTESNTVMVCQAALIAFIVKTCTLLSDFSIMAFYYAA